MSITPCFPITNMALRWLETILEERFGNSWNLEKVDELLLLRLNNESGSIIFDNLSTNFSMASSGIPITYWNAEKEGWTTFTRNTLHAPGYFSLPMPLIEKMGTSYYIHFDILGLAYWMLTRVEEIERSDLDFHMRFPASASHAYKHHYLDYPIVDEWLNILGQVILLQWSGLVLKRHKPITIVSCDVDHAFALNGSLKQLAIRSAGDLLKRKSLQSSLKSIRAFLYNKFENYRYDTNYQGLQYIMQVNEHLGQSVVFNFIPVRTNSSYDRSVRIDDPKMRKVLRLVSNRGHKVGVHPGYSTFIYPQTMRNSVDLMRQVLEDENIDQSKLEGRQHYLRWSTPTTACILADNHLSYDSTLGYADSPGFRCGTCFAYEMFNPVEQKSIGLKQRPLIVMECSIISQDYLSLGYSDEAYSKMRNYRDTCYRIGGQFTILWHNCQLSSEVERQFYKYLIS